MEVLVLRPGQLEPEVPPVSHRKVSVIDPRFRNRLILHKLQVRNRPFPAYRKPGQQPIWHNILELVDPAPADTSRFAHLVDITKPLEFEILQFEVRDNRFSLITVRQTVPKSIFDSFWAVKEHVALKQLERAQAGLLAPPAGRFKCYILGCLHFHRNRAEVGNHFEQEHPNETFDIEKVAWYLINGPDDPHLVSNFMQTYKPVSVPQMFSAAIVDHAGFLRRTQDFNRIVSSGNFNIKTVDEASKIFISEVQNRAAREAEEPQTIGSQTDGPKGRRNKLPEGRGRTDRRGGGSAGERSSPAETRGSARARSGRRKGESARGIEDCSSPDMESPHDPSSEGEGLTKIQTGEQIAVLEEHLIAQATGSTSAQTSGPPTTNPAQNLGPQIKGPDPRRWRFNDDRDTLVARYHARHNITQAAPADDVERFCSCQKPMDMNRMMVECSNGKECLMQMYHMDCMGLTECPGPNNLWFCPRCTVNKLGKLGRPTRDPRVQWVVDTTTFPPDDDEPQLPSFRTGPFSSNTTRSLAIRPDPRGVSSIQAASTFNVRPPIFRPNINRQLAVHTVAHDHLTMSAPSPVNLKPWTADLDKQFVNNPENIRDFGLSTLPEAQATLRSRHARNDIGIDSDFEITSSRQKKKSSSKNANPAISPDKLTPRSTWKAEEEQALIEVIKECTDAGLSGEPMWQAAYPKLKARGVNRPVGGMKMRWCRGLRESTKIDERRRKNADNLLTALQVGGKKAEKGIGRGKSVNYGIEARAAKEGRTPQEQKEVERQLEMKKQLVAERETTEYDDADVQDAQALVGSSLFEYSDEDVEMAEDDDIEIIENRTPTKVTSSTNPFGKRPATSSAQSQPATKVRKTSTTNDPGSTAHGALLQEEDDVQEATARSLEITTDTPSLTRKSSLVVMLKTTPKTRPMDKGTAEATADVASSIASDTTTVKHDKEEQDNVRDAILLSLTSEKATPNHKRAASVDLETMKGMDLKGL